MAPLKRQRESCRQVEISSQNNITMETQERVIYSKDDFDFTCVCGNSPSGYGFYPCDENGFEVEPAEGWPHFYFCDRCGRIIDDTTGYVVGRRPVSDAS